MQKLSYAKPASMAEALELMSRYDGKIKPYAGGTDLMVQLRDEAGHLADIEYLLDLGGLAELCGVETDGGLVRVGAMTTHTDVACSPLLLQCAPFLCHAASSVGSLQIRNRGTVGGNICNGSPAADTLSSFVALHARLVIRSVNGVRRELVKEVYAGANKVKLAGNEIVTHIEFERIDGYKNAFIKLGRRKALAISRMNAAVAFAVNNGKIADARVAPGCVFSIPNRVEKAELFLNGKEPRTELFERCGRIVSEFMVECTGVRWSTEYKRPVVEALTQRALNRAAGFHTT
jgi:carbon-monoxide dehydrogenase medium subunit/xanthine dehydrogenase FAD-binding subunit